MSTIVMTKRDSVANLNKHLTKLDNDYLYHIDLSKNKNDLPKMFGDVKFICMGGSPKRMLRFANYMKDIFGVQYSTEYKLENISENSDRYALYKVGSVLSVSHGIGCPSLSILLNELIKLIYYAGCQDVTFFRIGTSGGLGVTPGSIVISKQAVDGLFRSEYRTFILGREIIRESKCDMNIINELIDINKNLLNNQYNIVAGTTMCANDFYEGQARIDGVFCDYSKEEQLAFLNKCKENGITNFEMESLCFASTLSHAGIKFAIVCVTLLDRMYGDQITESHDYLNEFQERPFKLVGYYIKNSLNIQ